MYCAKNGNFYYTEKVIGERYFTLDKITMGWSIMIGIFVLIIGPLIIFSNLSGFVADNPAISGEIQFSFMIKETLDLSTVNKIDPPDLSNSNLNLTAFQKEEMKDSPKFINETVPYTFYTNKNPFFRRYTWDYFKTTKFYKWTETRFFDASQIQDCIASEFADTDWTISKDSKLKLDRHLKLSLNPHNENYHFEFGVRTIFGRTLPAIAKKSHLL